MSDRRISPLVTITAVVLALLVARLFVLQLLKGDGEDANGLMRDAARFTTLPAWRGPILDRRGEVLAADRPTLDLAILYPEALLLLRASGEGLSRQESALLRSNSYARRRARELKADAAANPAELLLLTDALRGPLDASKEESLRRYLDRRLTDLAHASGAGAGDLYASLQRIVRTVRKIHAGLPGIPVIREEVIAHPLVRDITVEAAGRIETQPNRFPGMSVKSGTARCYPGGRLAPYVVGVLRPAQPLGPGEVSDDPSVEPGELVGVNGVEKQYNRLLRGRPGAMALERDAKSGAPARRLLFSARPGSGLFLSLDAAAQRAAEEALGEYTGGVVVMDLRTGELLVAASAPLDQELSRVTQDSVASGSIIKPIVALAAAAKGFGPETSFDCRHDFMLRGILHGTCSGTHGVVDMRAAIAQSCNIYFWELGRKIGAEPVLQWARAMGWGERTGVDLPEWKGRLPGPACDVLNLCVGQEDLSVTPLQVAVSMGCIATGGQVLRPTILHRIEPTPDPELYTPPGDPVMRTLSLPAGALRAVRAGMRDAVESPSGTASNLAGLKELKAAVKTGTAETRADTINQAWIAGYFPDDAPRYAFAVVLHRVAGHGASAAGPIAEKVLKIIAQGERAP